MDSCRWEFGDGQEVSSIKNPLHLYPSPGTYVVNLTVMVCGSSRSCAGRVVVLPCDPCPKPIGGVDWSKVYGGSDNDTAQSIQQTTDGGYIVAGTTESGDGDVKGKNGGLDCWVLKLDRKGNLVWAKCRGGSGDDEANSVQQTSDGGYIVAGATKSGDREVKGNNGGLDCWVFKLDADGNLVWAKCRGGSGYDEARSVQQTSDGGYIVAGYTESTDKEVKGNHGGGDCWIFKLDAEGNLLWQKCLGGSFCDLANGIQQTSDGGYIVTGFTYSNNGDVLSSHYTATLSDGWVVKLDANGNIEWQKCLGGSGEDFFYSVQQTFDGGYALAGMTYSSDGDVNGYHPAHRTYPFPKSDGWVVKLRPSGSIEWQKCLGGSDWDNAYSIRQTKDGGYIVAGYSRSKNGDVKGHSSSSMDVVVHDIDGITYNNSDIWVVKLDANGKLVWQKCAGGGNNDYGGSILESNNGGYTLVGWTYSGETYNLGSYKDPWDIYDCDYRIKIYDPCYDSLINILDENHCVHYVKHHHEYKSGILIVRLSVMDCTISAPDSVYSGSTGNLASTAESGAVYAWSITNGIITSPSDARSITFTAGASGTIRLTVNVTRGGAYSKCYKDIALEPNCEWTSTSPVCNGTPVQFKGPSGMDSYKWTFDDGSSSTEQSPSHTYSAVGRYSVRLKVTKGGLSSTCAGQVEINGWSSNSPVHYPGPVQFKAPSGMGSYKWIFGDGSSSTEQSPMHTYSAVGTYSVRLTATKDGSSWTCAGQVEIKSPDCSWTSNSPVCNGTAVQFTGPAGMYSYLWSFGDGAVSQFKRNTSHIYVAPGTYTVSLNVVRGGFSGSCQGTVEVQHPRACNPAPVNIEWQRSLGGSKDETAYSVQQTSDGGYITAGYATSEDGNVSGNHGGKDNWVVKLGGVSCAITAPDSVCSDSTGNVASTAESGAAYNWSINNGEITSDKYARSITFSAGSEGTVTLEVKVTKADGSSSECSKDIHILPGPACIWTSNSPVCNGTSVQFDGPTGMDSYNWSFGDGSNSHEEDPVHLYPAPGTYAVSLTATACGGSKTCEGEVEVKPIPECNWTSNAPVCDGTAVQFSGPSGMDSYQWSFGDNETSTDQSPRHTYSGPGTYSVNLTVSKGGGSKTCGGTVTVKLIPDCSWTSNAPVCNGTPVQFEGPSDMDSYNWSFGDGSNSQEEDPVHLYSAPNTYFVNLRVTSCGGSKTCEGTVTINPVPACNWTSNASVCNGTPVQFTGPSGMDSYYWGFGDDDNSTAQSPSHTYSGPGTFVVKLTVVKDGCSKSCESSVTVMPVSDCIWTSNAPVCDGTPVQFTGPSGMDSYLWELGDGSSSAEENPSHTYSSPGTYSINLTVSKGGGSKTCEGTVTIKPLPDCSWTSNAPVCNGTSVQFDGPTGMDSYNWCFGDGSISQEENPVHLYAEAGPYNVSLIVIKAGCSKECAKEIAVTPAPNCTITAPDFVCANSTGNMASTAASGMAYIWSITNGQITTAKDVQSITFSAGSSGTVTLKVTVTKGVCSSECIKEIAVTPGPDCSWSSNSPVYDDTPVQFTGPTGMDSYRWEFGDGSSSVEKNPSHAYSGPGTYGVNLTVSKGGGSKTCEGAVTIKPLPDCIWTSNSPVCNGTSVQFTGPAGMDSYQWSLGDGKSSTDQSPSHTYSGPGTYAVKLTVSKDGCTRTCEGSVTVKPLPDCSWTSNSPVDNANPVRFTGPSGTDSYNWEFGDGSNSTEPNPSHAYPSAGTYNVRLTVIKGGCSKSCAGQVVVKSKPGSCWSSNSPVCNGTAVQFDGPSGEDIYKWDFGDGSGSQLKGPVHLYSAPGTYSVSLYARSGNENWICPGSVVVKSCQATVEAEPGPSRPTAASEVNFSWSSNSPVFDGRPVRFDGPSGFDRYLWHFGDGLTSKAEDPSHTYRRAGTYTVSLTAVKGKVSKRSQGKVVVKSSSHCS
jgi:PKD repeat protein